MNRFGWDFEKKKRLVWIFGDVIVKKWENLR